MSAPRCAVCHDSGSKNQTGDYLDCPACDMPHTRKALNDFVKSLGPTHPEDVALAIHQRALAMAPKQEALAGKLGEMELNHAFDYVTKPWAYVRNEDISRSRAYFKAGYKYAFESAPHSQMSSADHAAPAAANGAPKDERVAFDEWSKPIPYVLFSDYAWQAWQARAILAAAGPDAAPKGLELAAEQLAEYCENMGYYNSYVDDVRAALSGAKGN